MITKVDNSLIKTETMVSFAKVNFVTGIIGSIFMTVVVLFMFLIFFPLGIIALFIYLSPCIDLAIESHKILKGVKNNDFEAYLIDNISVRLPIGKSIRKGQVYYKDEDGSIVNVNIESFFSTKMDKAVLIKFPTYRAAYNMTYYIEKKPDNE